MTRLTIKKSNLGSAINKIVSSLDEKDTKVILTIAKDPSKDRNAKLRGLYDQALVAHKTGKTKVLCTL